MLLWSAIEQGFGDELAVSEADLLEDGFGPEPRFRAVIAEEGSAAAGMALFFVNYSTWGSRKGLYLEDIYVLPEHRKKGIAKALLVHLARIAISEGCGRFQWVVHCENTRAVRLYESLGALRLREWTLMSVKGEAIRKLAEGT